MHMAQLMSLASVKSRLVLPFWCRLTRVVPDKRACVRVCARAYARTEPTQRGSIVARAESDCLVTPPQIVEQSIVMSVSVCLCVFVCPRSYLWNYTSALHQTFFVHELPIAVARSSSGGVVRFLCTSGFTDDVIFAHEPRLLDVAAQLKRSAHAALRLAMNCAQ